MRKLNIAIIGYGGMASYHNRQLKENKYLNVVGIYDIDEEKISLARDIGLKIYPSYQSIGDDKEIDIVLIATPNNFHEFYVDYFAKAHKNILCEKPATLSTESFMRMMKVAESNGILLMVHQNRRWDKDYLTLKTVYDKSNIGSIYRIESSVTGANGIPGGWRKLEECGGGMMLDWGVHLIDQILDMVHDDVVEVNCTYTYNLGWQVDDGFRLEITFISGTSVLITVDTNTYVDKVRWLMYGLDGTLQISNWDVEGKIVTPIYDSKEEVVGIKAGNGFTKTMANRSHSTVNTLPLPNVEVDEGTLYRNLYECIVKGEEPIVKNEQVLRVIKIMELAKLSAVEHQIIKGKW